jgi:hypothetical protein
MVTLVSLPCRRRAVDVQLALLAELAVEPLVAYQARQQSARALQDG